MFNLMSISFEEISEIKPYSIGITLDSLPHTTNSGGPMDEACFRDALDSGQTLFDIEKRFTLYALDHFRGNKQRTAKALGLSARTLRNNINRFGWSKYKGKWHSRKIARSEGKKEGSE